ncbi:hypothetical protein L7F22_068585 [Adiantum nelumboides]|nr:hypothetical protein [Adiantum nelumboides]
MEKLGLRNGGCEGRVHVVAVPYPAQGHIAPMMELCRQMATTGGFLVTVVNTEHIHARMLRAGSHVVDKEGEWGSTSSSNLRLVSMPGGLPPELHEVADHVVAALHASEALAPTFHRLLCHLNRLGPRVTHILSDVMMSWTQLSAEALSIPRLAFWVSSASLYFAIYHLFDILLTRGFPSFKAIIKEMGEETGSVVGWIPGLPPISIDDLPTVIQSDEANPIYQFLMRQLKPLQRATCVVMNTLYELEEEALMGLKATRSPPIVAIGPLLPIKEVSNPPTHSGHPRLGGTIFNEDNGCLQWLHYQAPNSVLYISFGSLARMHESQFKELAAGLEASGTPFLWSIRPDFVDGGSYVHMLPPSFLERTRERGLLISWVPQVDVLSHPSIGGFLTHCGWNSILESVCMGIPILCWWADPGERRTNGLVATTKWGLGLDFGTKNTNILSKEEVSSLIKQFMGDSPTSCALRLKAKALRDIALLSLCPTTSRRSRAMSQLISHMSSHSKGPFLLNDKKSR